LQATCLRFTEVSPSSTSPKIVVTGDKSGCFAAVGYQGLGGKQSLNLGSGCHATGIAIHELGHAVGRHHTQTRLDRDTYITVNFQNIKDGHEHNFEKNQDTHRAIEYDYDSVMHYGRTSFSKNGEDTITPKGNHDIGQRIGLSEDDAREVNELYGCDQRQRVSHFVQNVYAFHKSHRITNSAFSSSSAFLVAADMPEWTTQDVKRASWSQLRDWIKEKWGSGYQLQSVRQAAADQWFGVMTKGTGIAAHGWSRSSSLDQLKDKIHAGWNESKRVLDLSYSSADDRWVLVMGQLGELSGQQSWKHSSNWTDVKEYISGKWKEGYHITTLTKVRSSWFVAMTQTPSITSQSWAMRSASTVDGYIKDKVGEGYSITSLFDNFDSDPELRYLVVVSKVGRSSFFTPPNRAMLYRTNLAF